MKNYELKEKLEGYLLTNVNELMVLISDICAYNYKSKLEYLQAYSMEEINDFACNYDFTDLFQMIDFARNKYIMSNRKSSKDIWQRIMLDLTEYKKEVFCENSKI